MVRLGQNFLVDTNLLDAIVRDAKLEPGDVVLEVGAGEGPLTERLAAVAAHVHAIELDRRLEPALAEVAALPNVELHWGDALKLDLAALDPAPTRVVSNLPYSIATPLILRTIERAAHGRALDGDGAARDRRAAALGPQPARVRHPERARADRLRDEDAAAGQPLGLPAAAPRRLDRDRAAARGAGRRRRSRATSCAPPSPTAASS